MPQNLANSSAENAAFVPMPPEALAFAGTAEERIAWAKDVIAGRTVPPPMAPTPLVKEFMDREFKTFPQPPTPEAVRRIIDDGNLEDLHGGDIVLVFRPKGGYVIVLAVGDDIDSVLPSLTEAERVQTIVEYP